MKNIKHMAVKLLKTGINTILPPRCIVTGKPVLKQGTVDADFWATLHFLGEPCCIKCGYPFLYKAHKDMLCPYCLKSPPNYNKHRSALAYNDASKQLILPFKHGDRISITSSLAKWMEQAGASLIDEADIIIPVPLHRWRLFSRRYNQAALLAHKIANNSKIPCYADALIRTRPTPSQGHLNSTERQHNVKNAFIISPHHLQKLKGKCILLIDDVYTTGATVKECTRTLYSGGVSSVNALTLSCIIKGE